MYDVLNNIGSYRSQKKIPRIHFSDFGRLFLSGLCGIAVTIGRNAFKPHRHSLYCDRVIIYIHSSFMMLDTSTFCFLLLGRRRPSLEQQNVDQTCSAVPPSWKQRPQSVGAHCTPCTCTQIMPEVVLIFIDVGGGYELRKR